MPANLPSYASHHKAKKIVHISTIQIEKKTGRLEAGQA
jgi:hypothetical protein